ncbi:MAG: hypothetical protein NT154_37590 [Verrucomicrobia bacterium]|nr:hypothetical protein [Verrucomicrobiota bacterium]
MKIKLIVMGVVACATFAAVTGCKKEEPATETRAPKPAESVPSEPAKAVEAATAAAKQATEQVATGAVSEAAKTVDAAKEAATAATDQAAAQAKAAAQQAQGLIDRAKSLVGDKKYQDALTSLGQLANVKLTPEQQKLVDDLKTQIQSALAKASAGDAASALGGALGGKK